MAQEQDFHVLGRSRLGEQGQPFGDAAEHEVEQA
jgi:hypothetical protein